MKTRAVLLLLAALAVAGCAGPHDFDNDDEQLAPNFLAKSMCSCIFVMQQPEDYCKSWAHQAPAIATYHIDRGGQTVEASALMFWGAKAKYQGPHFGCTLQ